MRRSVRVVLACVLLASAAALAPALSRVDFDSVVDFSLTLKNLADAAEGKAPFPSGKLLVLDGTVSDVNVISKDEATFKVRIELITGEWIGMEDVKSYSCYVDFTGSDFFKVFPARPPRSATRDVVQLNSRVVIVGRPLDITTTHQGEKRVLVEGLYVRTIE